MILFINGTFGIGKSAVASELNSLIESSSICDLEELGGIARSATTGILPIGDRTEDFQDIPLWRELSCATLSHLATQYSSSTVIVPMTIGRTDYFHQVISEVRARSDFRHYCLTAPLETVRARLAARGDSVEAHSWGIRKANEYIPNFESEVFDVRISTVGRSPHEIARQICAMSGIKTVRTKIST